MKTGDLIHVIDFCGRKIERTVVEISGDTVYICTKNEWDAAQKAGAEPRCVGFDKAYAVPCHGENDCIISGAFVSSE